MGSHEVVTTAQELAATARAHVASHPETLPFLLTEERKFNQELNAREYAERQTTVVSRPLAWFVELTQNCNLKCPMCRSGEKYDPAYNLPLNVLDKLAAEVIPLTHIVDLRGWGESTMLPWFSDTIDMFTQYRPQLRLVTNGQVNRSVVWEKLMRAHAMVVVSCDAATPELFTHLRGGGRLARLKDSVRELVRLRDYYNVPDRNVEILTVVSAANLGDLPGIISMAAELGVRKVTFNPIQTASSDCNHLRHDLPSTAVAYRAAANVARSEGVLLQLGAAPDSALVIPGMAKVNPCMHPWSYAYLDYAGRVGFCDHLIGNEKYTFGSVRDKSFEDIWNGPEWRRLRGEHVAGKISDRHYPCRWCFKNRYVDFEDRIHQSYRERVVSTETVADLVAEAQGPIEPPLPFI